jgi:hypothetical protein
MGRCSSPASPPRPSSRPSPSSVQAPAAKPLDAQDISPVETCTRGEREARAARTQWATFAEGNRRLCFEQTNVAGYPSYVDVLTCFQIYGPSSAGASTRPKRKFGL